MGLIARLLSFARTSRNGAQLSESRVDLGGNPNVSAEHFSAPGDDSYPLPYDYAYIAPVAQRGRYCAIGYVDPLNQPQAQPGDKRIYARDSGGVAVVELWLKNTGESLLSNDNGSVTLRTDGSVLGQNGLGSFELQVNGDFVVNGVTIAASGAVTIPSSLTLNDKEIAEHMHSQADDSAGNTQQDTGPNL